MVTVPPLHTCRARPDQILPNGQVRTYGLLDHLHAVAHAAGNPAGHWWERLAFLAGLLHDAGKCHRDWQDYINPGSRRRKGPPHAPLGAALLYYVADTLIAAWANDRQQRNQYRDRMLNWVLAVYGHHGKIPDFSGARTPWPHSDHAYSPTRLIQGCDHVGIFQQVTEFFPGFTGNQADFATRLNHLGRSWFQLTETIRPQQTQQHPPHCFAMRYPYDVARLIASDRLHAGQFTDNTLTAAQCQQAINRLRQHCQQQASDALQRGADAQMVRLRSQVQEAALQRFRQQPQVPFYSLRLPTGYGKTLTSLRVALEACHAHGKRRIVYVAPYLSILSQAAYDLASATAIDVVEHHHLSLVATLAAQATTAGAASVANNPNSNPNDNPTDAEDADSIRALWADSDDDFEVLDTWKVPILATTFNQLFRALFPARAQHALRIDALANAIIIIDEPQIIDVGVWNLFLRGLAAFTHDHGCQSLFVTATLPPHQVGLQASAVPLATSVPTMQRYQLQFDPRPLDPATLADRVQNDPDDPASVAVVLNTIGDAVDVYRRFQPRQLPGDALYCLTAMMLPHDKQRVIASIRAALAQQRQPDGCPERGQRPAVARLRVVCTQMIEAGVDVSFQRIWRAQAILPSLAQVAGRVNRHGEASVGVIHVFPFLSQGQDDRWSYVYRDRTARQATQQRLDTQPQISESQMADCLETYFEDCARQNAQVARLADFQHAAHGQWSRLAAIEPFGMGVPRQEVFVPLPLTALDHERQQLIARFAPRGTRQLLDRFLDPVYRQTLNFRQRKQLQIAVQMCVVPSPPTLAARLATQVSPWLWCLSDLAAYQPDTGLAHWLLDETQEDHGSSSDYAIL